MAVVVRNIQNSDLYEYLGENKFQNLRTGKEGVVSDEQAKDVFKINIEATEIISEYPLVAELINKCNLKFDNNKNKKPCALDSTAAFASQIYLI